MIKAILTVVLWLLFLILLAYISLCSIKKDMEFKKYEAKALEEMRYKSKLDQSFEFKKEKDFQFKKYKMNLKTKLDFINSKQAHAKALEEMRYKAKLDQSYDLEYQLFKLIRFIFSKYIDANVQESGKNFLVYSSRYHHADPSKEGLVACMKFSVTHLAQISANNRYNLNVRDHEDDRDEL